MRTNKFDFNLPENLIAIEPAEPRDSSKIVEVSEKFKIHKFSNIINILNKNDCIILNNTKVIPAKLEGEYNEKKISITLNKLINNKNSLIWSVYLKPLKKVSEFRIIKFSNDFFGKIIEINKSMSGEVLIEFNYSYKKFLKLINKYGVLALPPYITKRRLYLKSDNNNYQSIFAENCGAIAAPTASLHFSKELLNRIKEKGIKVVKVTLHVNGGTFIPVRSENINNHKMHYEFGEINKESADTINIAKRNGNKCIAVGTTVLRLLETSKNLNGIVKPFKGETNIFIKPGWKINTVDGIITNFHTPKSTLFILICSILGIKKAKELYAFAVKEQIRFYSYGDACLIWNKN